MKKIIIAMAAIAAAFTMASCNKEQPVSPNENTTVGKSVITASIENDLTKTTLEGNDDEGYKVFWSAGDNLFVGDYWEEDWCAEYKLDNTSAGSSNGVFSWQDGNFFYSASEGGEKKYDEPIFEKNTSYEAFYPLDFFNINDDGTIEGGLTWKTEQTYSTTDRYIPMYAITECAKEGEANFNFTNLGGLLRLTVKGTEEIARITIQANEPMSGDVNLIEDAEGNMVAEIVGGYPFWKNEVTLDCGNNGVALTDAGTDFYISLPCYMNSKKENIGYSNVTITLTDTDGRTCVKKLNNKNLVIERSKITTATFTASEFKANVPEGALPGKFTINEAGDQVYFSQGNLYWDGSAFKFEDSQTAFASEWDAEHVSHFFWSKTASVAYAELYSDSGTDEYDVFFTNATDETANSDFIVNGIAGKYRSLSGSEWDYLLESRIVNDGTGENHSYSFITYSEKAGIVLYSDDYTGEEISGEVAGLPEGTVFMPISGYRIEHNIYDIGIYGLYWTSSPYNDLSAHYFYFDGSHVFPDYDARALGCSVRLVTDCE